MNCVHAHQISQNRTSDRRDAGERQVLHRQRRHLGHGEHEDQVEEELDEGDGLGLGCVEHVDGTPAILWKMV